MVINRRKYVRRYIRTEPDAEAWVYRMSECGAASYKAEGVSDLQMAVLFQFSRYCQAMTEADTEIPRQIVLADMRFTHMSGRQA